MPKSYRFRTEPGIDKEVRIKIDQDFDFLEILSLKLRQEDLYNRFCADYGIVAGRVIANGGFGVPNVNVSVFVPLDNVDENDPIISTLYPYKSITTKNEDGYRYNLLPYVQEYEGHTPTGTFPDRSDILTRKEVLHVYEKYYRYTVRTNESGDFMIVGVPLGQHKLVMDLDLSNIGQFSLRPSDLIRMGRGVESQFNGVLFKSSEDLDSLPQIVNSIQEVDVVPFWGQDDLCDVGITRSDFDLRELGIEITPHAIFMGSIFSSNDEDYLKTNCKPKKNTGNFCDLTTGPGNIKALRQTIDVDENGDPIIEEYKFENNGYVIDDEGTWLTEIPMNLDYVITNEFGENIISTDPSIGIPSKGKYRFKVSWMDEAGLDADIMRAKYLIPNIKEHGWTTSDSSSVPDDEVRNKSYAFSLNWDDYYDKQSAIDCEDTFYQFNYNKVYTVASHIDRFKWGYNRSYHLGIKEINDRACQSVNNKIPVNDGQRKFDFLYFVFRLLISFITPSIVPLIIVLHFLSLLWPILKWVLTIYIGFFIGQLAFQFGVMAVTSAPAFGLIVTFGLAALAMIGLGVVYATVVAPLLINFKFKGIKLPMMSFPDCELCSCENDDLEMDEVDGDLQYELNTYNVNYSILADTNTAPYYTGILPDEDVDQNFRIDVQNGIAGYPEGDLIGLPVGINTSGLFMVYKNVTFSQSLNMMNYRERYFENKNIITTKYSYDYEGGVSDNVYDNVLILLTDPSTQAQINVGSTISFVNPNDVNDNNITGGTINGFGTYSITGTTDTENGDYILKNINGIGTDGNENTYSILLKSTNTHREYDKVSGIEYYQAIYVDTIGEVLNNLNGDNSLISQYILNKETILFCNQNVDEWVVKDIEQISGYENLNLTILVRGVDPFTEKQNIKYDLSVLFGYDLDSETIISEGEFYPNIPIQKNTGNLSDDWYSDFKTSEKHVSDTSNTSLFHECFNFNLVESEFTGFTSDSLTFYSSLDKSTSNYVENDNTDIVTNDLYFDYLNNIKQGRVDGGSVMVCFDTCTIENNINNITDCVLESPYYENLTFNTVYDKLIIRSDRLPTSDIMTLFNGNNSFQLHQNNSFAVYVVGSNGEITVNTNINDIGYLPDNSASLDFEEDITSPQISGVISTFSCGNMTKLDCYNGSGESFVVNPDCEDNITPSGPIVDGSCYSLVNKKYIINMGRDIAAFFEWKYRMLFMFGVCRGLLSETFQNNWLNGTLYLPSFQKLSIYDNDNNLSNYKYCGYKQDSNNNGRDYQGPLYFNTETNTFYYRSTPYNDTTNNFTGQKPSNTQYKGQNGLNIWYPTTIMELGPKDEFIQQTSLSSDFDGFYVNKLKSTSYNDTSQITNLFILSRLVNSTLLNQILSVGDSSIMTLFSREDDNKLFDGRVDGDFAQMVSINSEYGVIPYLDGNYPDSITVSNDRFGIWFGSNTINRRILTNGTTTFGNNPNGPSNTFGYSKTQEVPYYMWKIENNGLFGTQQNTWNTDVVYSSKYQGDDFFDGNDTYMKPNDGYGLGYIFNKSVSDNELDQTPLNNLNSGNFKVGSPFHFYFGLRRGKTAMNRFITKYLF